jgi:type IX secretion system PorP/SprF family membrane protein
MSKLRYTLAILTLSFHSLWAQDFHLSNYHPAGMLFNPAMTGDNGADIQAGLQFRTQWSAIPQNPYTTKAATGEVRFGQMGYGIQVHQNEAGTASLKSTGLMLTGAYHKQLAQDGDLSLGIGLGRMQKQVLPSLLTFDNQYSEGVGFDAALPSNETFERSTARFADFNIGLCWKGTWGNSGNLKSQLGLALAHVHLPNEGFFGEKSELPMKTVVNGSLDIKMGNAVVLTPHVMMQKQGVHQELLGGVRINGSFDKKSDFNAGLAYRWQDAAIIQVGFEIGNKSFWASYDSNFSPLEKATKGNGAWEMGLYLRFDTNKKKVMVDTDGDGVFDNRDKCPKVPGKAELEGCPEPSFSEKKDSDNDGVTDDLDRCPLEPGLACFYGCNDRDRDGTLDQDDACPMVFGPPENQGCPTKDRDADKDGVPDSEDYCVFLKGSPAFHGCPDSDQDGISDIDDQCPYLKGIKRNNGCPDGAGEGVGKASVIVHFDTDLSIISAGFQAELSNFASQLTDKQQVRLIISGHTDAEGTDAHNYELGLRRAKAVKDYLWRQGIPVSKMEIFSYGEEMPRRDNKSASWRADNRRAEVNVVDY